MSLAYVCRILFYFKARKGGGIIVHVCDTLICAVFRMKGLVLETLRQEFHWVEYCKPSDRVDTVGRWHRITRGVESK